MNTNKLSEDFNDILLDILHNGMSEQRKAEIREWVKDNFSDISSQVPFSSDDLLKQLDSAQLSGDFVSKVLSYLPEDSDDEQIERYLRNLMSDEESNLFNTRLKEDKGFRDKVKARVALIKNIKEVGAEQDEDVLYDIYDCEIERYFRNQMTQEEADRFQKSLKTNKTLREMTKARVALIKNIKEVGTEQDQEIIDSVHPNKAKVILLWTRIVSVAAVALLFISVGGRFYSSYELGNYVGNNFSGLESPEDNVSRGGSDDCVLLLYEISEDIKKGKDLSKHIEWLNKDCLGCSSTYTFDFYQLKYYAYLKDGNRSEAESVLDEIIRDDLNPKLSEWAKHEKENLRNEISIFTKIFGR